MDLSKEFSTSEKLEHDGAPLYLNEEETAVIYVRRINYPPFQSERNNILDKKKKIQRRNLNAWEKILREVNKDLIPKHIITNWKGVSFGSKEELPYSVANAKMLCAKLPDLLALIVDFSSDLSNYQDEEENEEDETVTTPGVVQMAKKSKSG